MSYTVERHWNYGPLDVYNTGRGLSIHGILDHAEAMAQFNNLCEEGYSVDLTSNATGLVIAHYGPPTENALASMHAAYKRRVKQVEDSYKTPRERRLETLLREVQEIIKQTDPEYCEQHDLSQLSGADVVQCLCEQLEKRIDKELGS